jgi:hypothetical protein
MGFRDKNILSKNILVAIKRKPNILPLNPIAPKSP